MNKIINTERLSKQNPAAILLGELVAHRVGMNAIEMMEKQGQEQLCASTVLPTEAPDACLQALEEAGIKFGDVVEGDALFRFVTLPPKWKLRSTPHNMWSELVDETNSVRVDVFYKAAFYDRRAFMRLRRTEESENE